jgi:diacylglycerol kinase family enzyme
MPTPHPLSRVRNRVGPRPLQRLAAAGALAADGLSLATVLVLVVSQPLFAVVVLVVAVAFVTSSLAALTASGLTRALLALLGVALVLTELVLVVFWGASRGLGAWVGPLALALLAVGFGLGRYALKVTAPPVPSPSAAGPGEAPGPRPRGRTRHRAVLLVNPRSGDGKAEEFDLVGLAHELGVHTVVLDEDADLVALAREAAEDGAEILGMAGGDGSQGCVLSVAADHGIPFVCVPSGTRNHLALDLGLDRRDPRQALRAFTEGEVRQIDHATVNGRVFVNNVALGLYAAIVDHDGYRDAKLATALELLPQLSESEGPWFELSYDVPELGPQTSSTLLLVSNNPYELTGGSIQRQRLDGGVLGVISLNPEGVRDLVGVTLATAAGRPEAARSLCRWETTALTVGSPHPEVVAGVDGETARLDQPLEFAIVPGGARVMVPPGSRIGLEEQRTGGGARFAGLLEVAFGVPVGRD